MPGQKHKRKIMYDENKFKEAIEGIYENKLSQRKASRLYGIPQATLSDRLTGKRIGMPRRGPITILPSDQERHLKRWVNDLCCGGFEITKQEVLVAVKELLDHEKKTVPLFHDNMPGDSWWYGFLSRHPDVKLPVKGARRWLPERRLSEWFLQYRYILEKLDIKDPGSIYVCYEPGFPLQSKTGKVIVDEFVKPCYSSNNSGKCQITAVLCFRADGAVVPPYVVFPGKHTKASYTADLPAESRCYATGYGTISINSFFDWFKDSFLYSLAPKSSRSKVVLILDGHSNHRDFRTSALARENDVVLMGLPYHTSAEPQHFDKYFLTLFKSNWKKHCHAFIEDSRSPLDKVTFGHVFQNAFEESFRPDLVIKSFETSGVWPITQNLSSLPPVSKPPYGQLEEDEENLDEYLLKISEGLRSPTLQHSSLMEDLIEPEAIADVESGRSNRPLQYCQTRTQITEIVEREDLSEITLNLTTVENASTAHSTLHYSASAPRNDSGRSSQKSLKRYIEAFKASKSSCAKALEAVEATLGLEDKALFEKRLEIERLTEDSLYAAWKHLKLELMREQESRDTPTPTRRSFVKNKRPSSASITKSSAKSRRKFTSKSKLISSSEETDSELEIATTLKRTPKSTSLKTNKTQKNRSSVSKTPTSSDEGSVSEFESPTVPDGARNSHPGEPSVKRSLDSLKITRRNQMRNAKRKRKDKVCGKCGEWFNTSDDEPPWIICNDCEWWYHLKCTHLNPNLTKSDVKKMKWLCSVCLDDI